MSMRKKPTALKGMKNTTSPVENSLVFNRRGYRRKPGYGLTYKCNNTDYTIYYGDYCEHVGMREMSLRWLAIYKHQNIIGRHSKRSVAEKTCQKHADKTTKEKSLPPKRKRRKQQDDSSTDESDSGDDYQLV